MEAKVKWCQRAEPAEVLSMGDGVGGAVTDFFVTSQRDTLMCSDSEVPPLSYASVWLLFYWRCRTINLLTTQSSRNVAHLLFNDHSHIHTFHTAHSLIVGAESTANDSQQVEKGRFSSSVWSVAPSVSDSRFTDPSPASHSSLCWRPRPEILLLKSCMCFFI